MKNGSVVDYSESDIIYHLKLDKMSGQWVVSDFTWEFVPGSEP
jgi:hypothetical protein